MHRLSIADARRVAVCAQLLAVPRPSDLVEVVRQLTLLQLDPTAAIAPNADLVLWSRLGSSYAPEDLVRALRDRRLFELGALVRPAEDVALYRARMDAWPASAAGGGEAELRRWQEQRRDWVLANDVCRRDVLARLETSGPLLSRDLPDSCAVPWVSTGWTHAKNVVKLLDLMEARGEVATAGRLGRQRLWDLASRVHADVPVLPLAEADRERNARRLRALGIARARAPEVPVEPTDVGESGEQAVVEGVPGTWRVDPAQLAGALDGAFEGRTVLLSPFDRLVHDRRRAEELFGFEYHLEMYKPAARRRWGYFALPVLHGDRLVGKLDARADRRAGVLRVHALHEDRPLGTGVRAAVLAEVAELAGWLGLAQDLPRGLR